MQVILKRMTIFQISTPRRKLGGKALRHTIFHAMKQARISRRERKGIISNALYQNSCSSNL
jgi:hypothetical protein